MGVTYKFQGLAELEAKLAALPTRLARRTLKPALEAAAAVIQQEAGIRAPRETGKLTTNVVVDVTVHNDLTGEAKIGPDKDAFYGMFSELGTAPHMEASPRGTKQYQHPGEPARPWLRPAFESKGKDAVEAMAKEIELGLKEIVG